MHLHTSNALKDIPGQFESLFPQLNGALPIDGTDILLTPELIGTCVLLPAQE